MNDFTVIETQEQLNAVIGNRIRRERETQEKKYSSYISPEDYETEKKNFEQNIKNLHNELQEAHERIEGLNREMAEREEQLKAYESHSVKTRIARQYGLPEDAIPFLQGEDEASLKENAESLKALIERGPAYTLKVEGPRIEINAKATNPIIGNGEKESTIWKAVRLF